MKNNYFNFSLYLYIKLTFILFLNFVEATYFIYLIINSSFFAFNFKYAN